VSQPNGPPRPVTGIVLRLLLLPHGDINDILFKIFDLSF
jgi:hypothetical protein